MDSIGPPTLSFPSSIFPVHSLNMAEAICESYSWEKQTLQPRRELQNNSAKLNFDEPNITWICGLPIVSLENQFQRDRARRFISDSLKYLWFAFGKEAGTLGQFSDGW